MVKILSINLPFKVDQVVERRSFIKGYRGAWFRCKISKTIIRRRELYYKLEYVDYTEERIHDTKVYQKFRGESYSMVRPTYPPHYHESEFLKIKLCQEPLLVTHGSWKIGDLVDWLCEGCYWSGKVLQVKENETIQIELFQKPFGEGGNYEASFKDLRPSLEWSLENGWIVPSSKDGQKRQCAKLIKQNYEEQTIPDTCEEEQSSERAVNKFQGEEGLVLNIMNSDEIEAAVYDLEELITRIEWLKGMLKPNVGEVAKSNWSYVDHHPSSK